MSGCRRNGRPAILLGSVLALIACGGGTGENAAETAAPAAASLEEAPATPGATTSAPAAEAGTADAGGFWLGEPRADIDRFFGVYGDADHPDELRGQFFVTEARRPKGAEQAPEIPPGYLSIGAVWADVAPMSMKSLSESTFENVDLSDFAPPEPIIVKFEFEPDGNAVAMVFKSGFDEFRRRERLGDLPEEWR